MFNSDFLEKGLGRVSPPLLVYIWFFKKKISQVIFWNF